MSLFNTPGADAAYDRYLEPPDTHEICACAECHDESQHSNPLLWRDECGACYEQLNRIANHVAIEFSFTASDLQTAIEWAQRNRYRYDTPEHLLLDAMREKVIHTDKWDVI